jgi:hypothetical protein
MARTYRIVGKAYPNAPVRALDKAAALVVERFAELDGDHYEILSPAADALAAKHPLVAILLLRAMIEFALKENRVKRYRHAARHLAECASLAVTSATSNHISVTAQSKSRIWSQNLILGADFLNHVSFQTTKR